MKNKQNKITKESTNKEAKVLRELYQQFPNKGLERKSNFRNKRISE